MRDLPGGLSATYELGGARLHDAGGGTSRVHERGRPAPLLSDQTRTAAFGVDPAAAARLCVAFHALNGWLKVAEPSCFLAAWVDFVVDSVSFARPAVQVALELGHDTFWNTLEHGINAGLDDLAETLDFIVPTSDLAGIQTLARRLRRSLFAGYVDRSVEPDELREELRTALSEYRACADR